MAFSAEDAEHVDAGGVRNPNPSRGLNKPAMAVELEPTADYVMAVYLSEDKLAVLYWSAGYLKTGIARHLAMVAYDGVCFWLC